MKLSKRLEAIVILIPENKRVIDVGCDHALLDIYLTLKGKNTCIASDINPNVLKKTREMIASYSLEDKIEVIQSDGLKEVNFNKEDVVVIAGMGTATILHILEEHHPDHLIIESHTHLKELREEIIKKGYVIGNEKVVCERNIYYVIIVFEKGQSSYSEKELFLGPILMKDKSLVVQSYFKQLLEKKQKLIENVSSLQFLNEEIAYLKSVL